MYLLALCYLLSVIHLFSDRQTIRKYGFDLYRPFTALTSFFIHLDATHYYYNVVGFFLQSFFIEFIFKDNLQDLLLLGIVTHVLAVVTSYFYYGLGGCGSSGVLFSWVPLMICGRIAYLFKYYSFLRILHIPEKLLSIMLIILVFILDKLYSEFQKKNYMILFTVSHIGHLVSIAIGYIYWLFFFNPNMHERLTIWFESNSFWSSNIPMSVNLHLIPFILVYYYKLELNFFISLDKYLRRLSASKIRLYNYEYIEVGKPLL